MIVVSTGDVEWSTDGLAMASRNCLISGMGSMLERSYVPWRIESE